MDEIGRIVRRSDALFADDTPVKMQAPGHKKTKTARIWTYVRDERPWAGQSPPCAWYQFTIDRKGEHPVSHLAGYKGFRVEEVFEDCVTGHAVTGPLAGTYGEPALEMIVQLVSTH